MLDIAALPAYKYWSAQKVPAWAQMHIWFLGSWSCDIWTAAADVMLQIFWIQRSF